MVLPALGIYLNPVTRNLARDTPEVALDVGSIPDILLWGQLTVSQIQSGLWLSKKF